MPGPLLYQLLKTKSEYPLHSAVRLQREDVVFLYLVEHNAEVSLTFIKSVELFYLYIQRSLSNNPLVILLKNIRYYFNITSISS